MAMDGSGVFERLDGGRDMGFAPLDVPPRMYMEPPREVPSHGMDSPFDGLEDAFDSTETPQEAAEHRDSARFVLDHSAAEEPEESADTLERAAGGGSDKPPIDRGPQDGAADMPDEPEEGTEGHVHDSGVLEGVIDDAPARPVEIHHGERHDVVVNRRHPNQELVEQVAERVKNGIPESWHRLPSLIDRAYYTDSPDQPTLFAKTRGGVNLESYEQKRHEIDLLGLNERAHERQQAMIRAEHSVLSEMNFAPKIHEALNEAAVRETVQAGGFESLSYVEPLAAISHKDTGEKTVVYPYQDGVAVQNEWIDAPAVAQATVEKVQDIISAVDVALINRGIAPNDHNSSQYLMRVDAHGGRHLHLIDTEYFAPLTAAEQAEPPELEPELAPGGVEYYHNHQWYEVDATDDDASNRQGVFEAPRDGIVIGRRSDVDVSQGPVLQARLDGGRAVAIWNERGEGAVVHFSRDMMRVEDAQFRMLAELIEAHPALGRSSVRAWVVGDEVSAPRPMSAWFANAEIRTTLWELGIDDPKILSVAGVHSIELQTGAGDIRPFDENGNQLLA